MTATVAPADDDTHLTPDALQARLDMFRTEHPPRTLVIGDIHWTFRDTESGARNLILLPGAVGNGDLFFILAQELAPHYRVVAIDLPRISEVEDFSNGLRTILDSLGISVTAVLGASYGGMLAQAFVRHHPERVEALILSATAAPSPRRAASSRRWSRIAGRLPLPFVRVLLRTAVSRMTRRSPAAAFWRTYFRFAIDALNHRDLAARYEAVADLNEHYEWTSHDLVDWRGQVLIIESDDDPLAKKRTRRELHILYPQAHVHTLHAVGHGVYANDPMQYAFVVRNFLDDAE